MTVRHLPDPTALLGAGKDEHLFNIRLIEDAYSGRLDDESGARLNSFLNNSFCLYLRNRQNTPPVLTEVECYNLADVLVRVNPSTLFKLVEYVPEEAEEPVLEAFRLAKAAGRATGADGPDNFPDACTHYLVTINRYTDTYCKLCGKMLRYAKSPPT